MKAPATPSATSIPAFLQLGDNAGTIFNTAEISAVCRQIVNIREANREQHKGFVTPDGQVYIISIGLKGERFNREVKCASKEVWESAFAGLSKTLNSYVINPKNK